MNCRAKQMQTSRMPQIIAIEMLGRMLLFKHEFLDLHIILTGQSVQPITHKQSIAGRTIPSSNGTDVLE